MKNLKEYLTEAKEVYYILYLDDLSELSSLNDLDTIEPEYILKNGDYNEEDDEIKVKGSWEFYASEDTNFFADENNDETPRNGDIVFNVNDEFCLYRKNLNTPTGSVNNNALIGTLEDIKSYLKKYAKEMKSDYDADVNKLI